MNLATASVDAQSDLLVQHALQTQFQGTTIISIAHRAATLVWMDRIIVLEDGRIVEQGSPQTLLKQKGHEGFREGKYRRLIATQGEDYLNEVTVRAGQ